MISKENVKHIAELARLGLTAEEITKYQKELSKILEYIDKLKEVDIEGIEPTSHPFLVKNVMRKDEQAGKRQAAKLLKLAPKTYKGFLKVKSVLKFPK